ncbi:MAG: hypothetical protein WBM43_04640 [Flavobacteriaceae bacterium]
MDLQQLRLLFDLSLFILILLVQIIIYPGFRYYSKNDLIFWHRQYTKKISFVVIPLMVGQLIITIIFLLNRASLYDISVALLVIAVWIITFLYFVPAHRKISDGTHSDAQLKQMLHINWLRTAIWFLILLISFLEARMD